MSKKIANHIQKNLKFNPTIVETHRTRGKQENYISVCFIFNSVQTPLYSLSLLSHYPILVDFHNIKANIQRNLVFKFQLYYMGQNRFRVKFWLFLSFPIFYQLIEFLKLIEKCQQGRVVPLENCFQGRVVMSPAPISIFKSLLKMSYIKKIANRIQKN